MTIHLTINEIADGRRGHSAGGIDVGMRTLMSSATRQVRGVFRLFWIITASLWAMTSVASAQDAKALDYQVKAAFLVNFHKYVDWPAGIFPETNSPVTVAVFGDSKVADEFETMIESRRKAGGRPLVLKRITEEGQIGDDCHIVFIAAAESARIPALLEKLKGKSVLTVGEDPEFLDRGGIINLVPRDRKIRLQVNLTAATAAQLKISAKLLNVAEVKGKSD